VFRHAHNSLGFMYEEGGDLMKAKFHYKVAAMAGHELARYNIGVTEGKSGNREQAVKIAASAG
jgi:TPR repeat protein